ncbi:MAG TPA: CocE/NonD family hydrolase [Baekduia sp.]|nr:CocE/NonD family hydrolase [Baekduia sp.]
MSRAATLVATVLLALSLTAATATAAGPKARGSVEQVQATGVRPHAKVVLLRHGHRVGTDRAGSLGGALFRHVRPGRGYRVRAGHGTSRPVRVLTARDAPPSPRIYDQRLPRSGYGYLTTRDGTKLAIDVHLPGPAGPKYPTLVEYSGYGYANPAGGESSIAQVANALGYAVVDVNMRGTGCSGGAFDYFERLQSLDGYDVVETVARQPWVLNGRPGMMGISYGGISQLFTAQTDPPHLAAITPLSVIDNTITTLYPGGILNTGFALSWAKDRVHDAKPASKTGGQPWVLKQIASGDRTCKANQALHTEAVDLLAKTHRNRHYKPKVADPLAPITFVHKIKAPTFLACQWTDEQTGGHCPALASHFTGTTRKWFTFTNGTHIDSLDPATFNRWFDFLELYVAHRRPALSAGTRQVAPVIFQAAMGIPGVTLPDDPIQAQPTYEAALAAFEAQPPVRILFDNGAGGAAPGLPYPGFEQSYASWPAPGTEARSFYLGDGGTLEDAAPAAEGADGFTWDQGARPATSFTGNTAGGPGGLWTATPEYRWLPNPAGTAAVYTSAPLAADAGVVGAGEVDAWVRSSAPDVDLQVSISEVRPDGKEVFVQNGWVRASERKLDAAKSTPLAPVLSLRRRDVQRMPSDAFAAVTVPLYYQGHVYRAGSRIRLTITAPSGDQSVWAFGATVPKSGGARIAVAHGGRHASVLRLPVVAGLTAPTPLPPCPGLRGEACRDAMTYVNDAATP